MNMHDFCQINLITVPQLYLPAPQVSDPASLSLLSSLLEVSPGELEDALTGRVIAAHGDVVRKLHSVEDAQRARDAFTKVTSREKYCPAARFSSLRI